MNFDVAEVRLGRGLGWPLVMLVMGQARLLAPRSRKPRSRRPAPRPQTRPHGQRMKVDPAAITVEDGDGVDRPLGRQ